MAVAKRQTHTRMRIENHDSDTIFRGKHVQRLLSGRCNTCNVRLHATADIQQQQDVNWHVLASEVANRHNMPIDSQNEIARLQASYCMPALIKHLCINSRQRNVTFESDSSIFRIDGWDEDQSEHEQ